LNNKIQSWEYYFPTVCLLLLMGITIKKVISVPGIVFSDTILCGNYAMIIPIYVIAE
jgi:hypothetical protein